MLTLNEGVVHLQSFSRGSMVELLWVVIMCGCSLGLYRFIGHLNRSIWMSFFLLVILPIGIIYVHHITIGSRYAIIRLDEPRIILSGRPFSSPRSFLISELSQVHLIDRNDGEELEMEFRLDSGTVLRMCHVYGTDHDIVARLQVLIARMRSLGIYFKETNITAELRGPT